METGGVQPSVAGATPDLPQKHRRPVLPLRRTLIDMAQETIPDPSEMTDRLNGLFDYVNELEATVEEFAGYLPRYCEAGPIPKRPALLMPENAEF